MTFTPSDTLDYATATATTTITVTRRPRPRSPGTPRSPIVYGTRPEPRASSTLPPTCRGPSRIPPPPVPPSWALAASTLSVTFHAQRHSRLHDGDGTDHDHRDAYGHARDRLGRPAPIVYCGTAWSSGQLDASGPTSPGTFSYTPAAGTILAHGSDTLSVTFTPSGGERPLDYIDGDGTRTTINRDAGHARDSPGTKAPGPIV